MAKFQPIKRTNIKKGIDEKSRRTKEKSKRITENLLVDISIRYIDHYKYTIGDPFSLYSLLYFPYSLVK